MVQDVLRTSKRISAFISMLCGLMAPRPFGWSAELTIMRSRVRFSPTSLLNTAL